MNFVLFLTILAIIFNSIVKLFLQNVLTKSGCSSYTRTLVRIISPEK